MKNDLATKSDIQNAIEVSEKKLHNKIASVKTDLNAKIDLVRTDLKKDIALVASEVVRLSTDLNDFKQETRQQHHTVLNAIDGLTRLITDNQTEKVAVDHALRRHDVKLENHESRIEVLEGK